MVKVFFIVKSFWCIFSIIFFIFSTGNEKKFFGASTIPNKSYQGSSTTANEWVINYDAIGRYHVGGNQKSPLDFLSNLF